MSEPTMTLVCTCGNQYGRWRERCPACGTARPEGALKPFNPPETRAMREPRRREPRPDGCVLCQRRVKPKHHATCPHCLEIIHKHCLPLHVSDCERFQQQRVAELKRLGVKENNHV